MKIIKNQEHSMACPLEKASFAEHCGDTEGFYSPDFFRSPTQVEKTNAIIFIKNTLLLPQEATDVPRLEARGKYAELNSWNREMHERMVDILEETFLHLADRITNFIITQPQEITRKANAITSFHIPYRFAGLPPNLYDHLDVARPFLPSTQEEVLELVSGFHIYNERLQKTTYLG